MCQLNCGMVDVGRFDLALVVLIHDIQKKRVQDECGNARSQETLLSSQCCECIRFSTKRISAQSAHNDYTDMFIPFFCGRQLPMSSEKRAANV